MGHHTALVDLQVIEDLLYDRGPLRDTFGELTARGVCPAKAPTGSAKSQLEYHLLKV